MVSPALKSGPCKTDLCPPLIPSSPRPPPQCCLPCQHHRQREYFEIDLQFNLKVTTQFHVHV